MVLNDILVDKDRAATIALGVVVIIETKEAIEKSVARRLAHILQKLSS